ncbi:MAG: AURKAIP1/COX24 domain-containing protein [Nitrospirae bacterium]|nr:AURKAIP1/COX24 domain-containing protein [Nitrospirota bacterium]
MGSVRKWRKKKMKKHKYRKLREKMRFRRGK